MTKFLVYDHEFRGDQPWVCNADDHENAAKKYAHFFHTETENSLIDSNLVVSVSSQEDDKQFIVRATQTVSYFADPYVSRILET